MAAEVARRFAGQPESEFRAWLRMAEQREAMVVVIYDPPAIRARLPRGAETHPVANVITKAIGGIWAHETSHTRRLDALRQVGGERATVADEWFGTLQGMATDLATRAGVAGTIARWLIGLGRTANQVPEFTSELAALGFRTFCRFAAELEDTAADGYTRMAELVARIESADDPLAAAPFGFAIASDIEKTLDEERFHSAVLRTIADWIDDDDVLIPSRAHRDCVLALRDLGTRILGRPKNAQLEGQESTGRGPEPWISDGGLGALFEEYGMAPVVSTAGPSLVPPG